MRIDVSKLSYTKPTSFSEDIIFDDGKFTPNFPLKEIKHANVRVKATRYDDFINVHFSVKAKVTLVSAYSLKEFETTLIDEDELNFVSSEPDYEDEDVIVYKGNQIDLDEYVFALISSAVPLKPIMDGEIAPKGGKNYIVTTDENEVEIKKEVGNNKFSKLDELEFD